MYDIELPADFVPNNTDGEVESFELVPAQDVLDLICSPAFKTTSAPVTIDFLIRKGIINIENGNYYPLINNFFNSLISCFDSSFSDLHSLNFNVF